jgi:hypothetical protein
MTPEDTIRDLERRSEGWRHFCQAKIEEVMHVTKALGAVEHQRDEATKELHGLRAENAQLKADLLVARALAKRTWLRRLLSWK